MMFTKFAFLIVILTVQTCGHQTPKQTTNKATDTLPYDLSNPTTSFNLDGVLHEISGLTSTTTEGQLAAIADESGQLFYIDTQTGKTTPSVIFQNSGDFEGIEFVNDTLWATTSKGKLCKVWHLNTMPFESQIVKNEPLKMANIEGLGYDRLNHRLLLASKGDKADGTQQRAIWAYDVNKDNGNALQKIFDIQLTDIQRFLSDKKGEEYAKLTKDYVEKPIPTGFEFGPSGIAVHPSDGHIYIVSSLNKVLIVLTPEGKILDMAKLDKKLFPQPEGLCFDNKGTLYISNEAKDNPTATLLVFKMQKK